MKVVMATDGSDAAIDAAHRSIDLLPPDAQIAVVMVVPERIDPMEDAGGFEGPVITEKHADKDWKSSISAAQSALDRTAKVLGPGVEVHLVPDCEKTGAAVVRVAHELKADVLVIGSSDKNWLSRLMGNHVSDYVAHHAPCPVMLIRHDH